MKAVLIRQFGPPGVMKIEEVETPAISKRQVLIRVRYASVNPVDWRTRNGSLKLLTGSRFPMFLGLDVAGEVVELGPAVSRCRKGDRVYGMLRYNQRGAYAEYAAAGEDDIALIPECLDYREAAAVPLAGLTAYQALHHKGKIASGDTVLVNGASGGVGSFAVQIAKAAGTTVAGVCGSDNMGLVESLGADRVLDYRKEDFRRLPDTYDIVFDAVGKLTFFKVRKTLNRTGRYVTTLPDKPGDILSFFLIPFLSFFGYGRKSAFVSVKPNSPDLEHLSRLLQEGSVRPRIDRVFPLTEIAEAHVYSETGHARGKIVIEVS
ncbi:MAG: NAD(P)-dependent alcohol dehydrogenase [Nitrospirae bacterium]|nr:NAD(P)-dependent alcohol dehydrogenase [Nitrospirota bacterium]